MERKGGNCLFRGLFAYPMTPKVVSHRLASSHRIWGGGPKKEKIASQEGLQRRRGGALSPGSPHGNWNETMVSTHNLEVRLLPLLQLTIEGWKGTSSKSTMCSIVGLSQ